MKAYLEGNPLIYEDMESQADRIERLLIARGVPSRRMRSMLADVCGIAYQSVKGWFDGTTKTITAENLAKIAKKWDANLGWLVSGTGKMDADNNNNVTTFGATEHRNNERLAPVISWVQAGSWEDVSDPYPAGYSEEWERVPDQAGPHAFWLRVVGDSMTSPVGLSVTEGMLILVDPDYAAISGSLVVAKLTDSQQATFKRYIEDGGKQYLKPLNPVYPMMEVTENCVIIGAVREAKIKL